MASDQLRQYVLGAVVAVFVLASAAAIFNLTGGDFFSVIGAGSQECGTNELVLEGETFSNREELRSLLADREASYQEVAQGWNVYERDGELWYRVTGEACQ